MPSKTTGVILSTPVATTTSCTPESGSVKDSLSSPLINIRFSLKSVQVSDIPEAPDGACWHSLFRSPVIVTGFPILSRPENEKGLELSLEMMSFLAGTPFATHFDNVLVLKGVSTMLVPTERTKNSITWHFLQDKNGKRLPYYAFRIPCSRHLDTSQVNFDLLSTARIRNFVGWVPSVTRHLGTDGDQYEGVDWASAKKCSAGCVLEKVSISASKYISIGTTMARGSKNKPEALKIPMFSAQIEQAREMFVILYDTSLRGWLVDEASALVHIVRTRLVKEPYKDSLSFQISEFNHPKDDSGPDAAKEALLDRENQRLFVLEELDSFSRELNTPTPNILGLTTDNEPGDVQKSKTSDLKEKTKIWHLRISFHRRGASLSISGIVMLPNLHHQHYLS